MSVRFLCLAISLVLFLPYRKGLCRIYSKCLSRRSLPEPRGAVSNRDFLSSSKNPVVHVHNVPALRRDSDRYRLSFITGGDALLCICIAGLWCTFPGSRDAKGPKPTASPCPGNLPALYRTEQTGNMEVLFVLLMGRNLTCSVFFL